MKKTLVVITALLFAFFNAARMDVYGADIVSGKIATEKAAEELAEKAGGRYIRGASQIELTGNQVALPVVDEASGSVLGHIVAEQGKLVSTLNAAGLGEVASAVSAFTTTAAAGAAAGSIAAAGVASGTAVAAAVTAAAVAGVALSVSEGGDTTSNH